MGSRNRNAAIDFMKIVGATLIVLHHYQQGTKIELEHIAFFNGNFNFGYVVEMFFVISGLLANNGLNRQQVPTIQSFGGGKIRRIMPTLAVSVILETILRYAYVMNYGNGEFDIDFLDILVNSSGMGWGYFETKTINQPTWYIAVLTLCWIEIYAANWLSRRLGSDKLVIYGTLILLGLYANTYGWKGFLISSTIGRGMVSFFAGAILAEYVRGRRQSKKDYLLLIIPIIFVLLLNFAHDFVSSGTFVFYTAFMWIPILIVGLGHMPEEMKGKKIISFLGMASFGVYVWNEPLSVARNIVASHFGINLQTISAMCLFVSVNWIVGICSFLLIEKPADRYFRERKKSKGALIG